MTARLTGKESVFISGIGRGVQDEHDEQLRILNEEQISDPELRKQIVKMRDSSYELC